MFLKKKINLMLMFKDTAPALEVKKQKYSFYTSEISNLQHATHWLVTSIITTTIIIILNLNLVSYI